MAKDQVGSLIDRLRRAALAGGEADLTDGQQGLCLPLTMSLQDMILWLLPWQPLHAGDRTTGSQDVKDSGPGTAEA